MAQAPAWLTYGFTYLAAAVIAVPIARALGLGAIIGYLAAGIAIGPWGLALVSNVQDILHFAEFGVVLMLFLVGLELQPQRLWSLRRPILGLGSAQMAGCALLLWAAAWALGLPWRMALVGALGLALSSTAIALQVLAERNLMRTDSGQKAFSILLFQDVAAIPILALLPLLGAVASAQPHSAQELAGEALRIAAAVGAIVLGGRWLLRPVLRWIARSKQPEIFTAASLFLVVGIAMLMLSIGLSMALGAFLAGVLLADSEYRRELETDIEPFKGLLLGLFFIAVGMSIDFGVLARAPGTMLALLLGFLAIKALVIWLLARATAMPYQERPVFTLLLAQGGEFAFVVFQTGASFGAIRSEAASLLIGAVALSMLLSPLLLVLLDRWLLPRHARLAAPAQAMPDERTLREPQGAPVIIAGFGRYGQIVARMVLAQGLPATVLDHSVEMLEVAHTFGYRVFYGDATRVPLLRLAGAESARVLVVAVDAPEQSLKIVQAARKHFPHLQIVARARDVTHWHALRELGVQHAEREVFRASVASARTVLELMGQSAAEAQAFAERFTAHNMELSERMYAHHHDREAMIAVARQGRQQLVEQLAKERQERMAHGQAHSDAPPPDLEQKDRQSA